MNKDDRLAELESAINDLRSELQQLKKGKFTNVKVNHLILMDENEKMRGLLSASGLSLLDENGAIRMQLLLDEEDMPEICLYSSDKQRLSCIDSDSYFIYRHDGSLAGGIGINNETSDTILVICDQNGGCRIVLGIRENNPEISINDSNEVQRIVATYKDGSSGIFITDGEKSRINIDIINSSPKISINDDKGNGRLIVKYDGFHDFPCIALLNKEGEVTDSLGF